MGIFDHDLQEAVKRQAKIIEIQLLDSINLKGEIKQLYKELNFVNHKLHKCECLLHRPKAHPVYGVLTTIINNSKFIIMELDVKENEFSLASLALIDSVTKAVVPTAVFKNVVAATDDPAVAVSSFVPKGTVFTADVTLPDGSVLPAGQPTTADYIKTAGVAGPAGEPPIRTTNSVVKADVDYTNSLGEPSTGSVVVTTTVSVTAIATADGVELQLTYGPAQLQFV